VFGSLIIAGVSAVLLLYWFRYSCLLIVRSRKEDDLASEVAQANGLSFPDVRAQVDSVPPRSLEALYRSLEDDRRILTYLITHTLEPDVSLMERNLLAMDYALMRAWYKVASVISLVCARAALREMSDLVGCLACAMGRSSAAR
jgi:hypothetical protein